MPDYRNHPAVYAIPQRTRFSPGPVVAMGGLAAVVGGSVAAARNMRRVRDGDLNRGEALADTLREAAGTGLAAAAATALVTSIGGPGGFLSLVGVLALGTGAKYLWDSSTAPVAASPGTPARPRAGEAPSTAPDKAGRTKP